MQSIQDCYDAIQDLMARNPGPCRKTPGELMLHQLQRLPDLIEHAEYIWRHGDLPDDVLDIADVLENIAFCAEAAYRSLEHRWHRSPDDADIQAEFRQVQP